jgi:hypothetical protein
MTGAFILDLILKLHLLIDGVLIFISVGVESLSEVLLFTSNRMNLS